MPSTKDAVLINKDKKLKKADKAALRVGESRIAPSAWDSITATCKGETSLLAALGVTDERAKA